MAINEFCAYLGVSAHTYYKAVRGEGVRFSTMKKIAKRLGVEPQEIEEFVIRGRE